MNSLLLLSILIGICTIIGLNNKVNSFLPPMQRMLLKKTTTRASFLRRKMTVQSVSTTIIGTTSTTGTSGNIGNIGVSNELETRFLPTDVIQSKLKENPNFFKNKSNHASVQFSPFIFDNNQTSTSTTTNTNTAASMNNKKFVHIIRHAQGTHNVNREYRNVIHRDAQLTQYGIEQCIQVATRITNIIKQQAEEQNQQKDQDNVNDVNDNNNNDNDNDNDTDTIGLQSLINAITNNESIVLVTSPMIRCIQTTLYCFIPLIEYYIKLKKESSLQQQSPNNNSTGLSIIVHDNIRETVNYECDHRNTIDEIQKVISEQFPIHITSFINYTSNVQTNHDNIWEYYLTKCGPAAASDTATSTDNTATTISNTNENNVWIQHRESAEIHKVAERGKLFFQWLDTTRTEQHVIICSHAAFLRCITNFAIDVDENDHDDSPTTSTSTKSSSIPMLPKQLLNPNYPNCSIDWIPVIKYSDDDDHIENTNNDNSTRINTFKANMRKDFQNCELRSVIATFPPLHNNKKKLTCPTTNTT